MARKRLLVLALLFVSLAAMHVRAADLYVSPSGNDTNPGTRGNPLRTLTAARDVVRKRIAMGLTQDLNVLIGDGTFRIEEPIVFGFSDGGSDRFRVTYSAAPGAQPVISGGIPITGWKPNDDGSWSTTVTSVAEEKLEFRELYVAGRRARRARHPNTGFLRVEAVGNDGRTSFRFKEGDLTAYPDTNRLELIFLHDWSISRVPVQSIDESRRTLTVTPQVGGPAAWAVMNWFERHPRYFLENSPTFLDAPGEWHLNRESGVLTYRPRAGEDMNTVAVVAPIVQRLLVVSGDPRSGRAIRNLHFNGLSLRHSAWSPAGGVYWGRQACTYWTPNSTTPGQPHEEADPAAVQFEMADSCSFTNGRVEHVGASAISFARGCRQCRVSGNVVSDVGGNGIMIGEGQARRVGDQPWWLSSPEQAAHENQVDNNLVEFCGQQLFGAVGIWMGLASRTTIANNEVRNLPYSGISIGWMWWDPQERPKPRATPCRETRVVDNHIHHTLNTLSDGGCIYALGAQPGSALRGNLIHDVVAGSGRAESNGMFLDAGSGELVIEENVIYNVANSPLRFNHGWKNVVRNNVLEVGRGVPTIQYHTTARERIRLESNTVVRKIATEDLERAHKRAGRKSRPRLFRER